MKLITYDGRVWDLKPIFTASYEKTKAMSKNYPFNPKGESDKFVEYNSIDIDGNWYQPMYTGEKRRQEVSDDGLRLEKELKTEAMYGAIKCYENRPLTGGFSELESMAKNIYNYLKG